MMSESGSKGTATRAAKSGQTARVLVRRTKRLRDIAFGIRYRTP